MDGRISEKFRPTLPLDAAHYRASYEALVRAMRFQEPYESWYGDVLGPRIRQKLADRAAGQAAGSTLGKDRPLRHLGVGSGSGELEREILISLLEASESVYNRVVDPSVPQLEAYRELARKDPVLASRVEFDWRPGTLDEYMAGEGPGLPDQGFDVITAVHSIYYGGRMEDKVPYLYGALADGGVLAIVLICETDDLSKVQSHFLSPDIPGYRYYTKEKLQAFLDGSCVGHEAVDIPRCLVDVTPCFQAESQEGALLVDFLSHMRSFRTQVAPAPREEFLRRLGRNARLVDGRCLVSHDTSAVLVQRDGREGFGV